MIYRYDGSLAGLLTVLAVAAENAVAPEAIERSPYADDGLFESAVMIPSDPVRAGRVRRAIRARLGPTTLRHLHRAYLSEQAGIEHHIWGYLQHGKERGPLLNSDLTHPHVHAVLNGSRRTSREAHRMKGFARFRELADGTLYAPYQTDSNVLPLLAPHFARRMDRPWLLHDKRRELGAMGEGGRFVLGTIGVETAPEYAPDEMAWQRLWQLFHKAIAVETRRNTKLQQQFVPLKYRDFLVEFQS